MFDISDVLRRASEENANWAQGDSLRLIDRICGLSERIRFDWDEGVPEGWASVFDDQEVIGAVRIDAPLVVLPMNTPWSSDISSILDAILVPRIEVQGWEDPELSLDLNLARSLFPDWGWHFDEGEEDTGQPKAPQFSAGALCWATM